MKRTNSLVGSIFGTVIHAVQSVLNLYSLYYMYLIFILINDISSSDPENVAAKIIYTLLFFAVIIIELISITALILSCVSFSSIRKPHEVFAKKKGVIIALIVFNFILIALFATTFLGAVTPINFILNIVSIVVLLVANILYIVDLAKEKKRATQAQAAAAPVVETEEQAPKAE